VSVAASTPESTPRVLVVDDEPDIRDLVCRILERGPYAFDEAENGIQGLEKIAQADYAAVLLDLMMPGLGGLDVLRILAERNPAVLERVIVMTGATDDLVKQVDPRVFAVLRKPFPMKALLETVRRRLEERP